MKLQNNRTNLSSPGIPYSYIFRQYVANNLITILVASTLTISLQLLTLCSLEQYPHNLLIEHNNHLGSKHPRNWTKASHGELRAEQLSSCEVTRWIRKYETLKHSKFTSGIAVWQEQNALWIVGLQARYEPWQWNTTSKQRGFNSAKTNGILFSVVRPQRILSI